MSFNGKVKTLQDLTPASHYQNKLYEIQDLDLTNWKHEIITLVMMRIVIKNEAETIAQVDKSLIPHIRDNYFSDIESSLFHLNLSF